MHTIPTNRTRAIQLYLTAVVVVIGLAYAMLGPSLDRSSALLIAALLLGPAVIAYRVWPDPAAETAMDVMRHRS